MTARLPLTLLLAATIAAAQAQDANPITYSTPAVPASKAIEEIARLSGEKLKVDPPLDGEPLILNLHSAITKDVLDWLAEALNGSWSDDGYVKTLRRTRYQVATLGNSEKLARAARITQALKQAGKGSKVQEWTKADAAQAVATGNASQADRILINRVLPGLNASEIAGAPYPDDIVYASHPRPLQYTLRLEPSDLSLIFREQNTWTRAIAEGDRSRQPRTGLQRRIIDPNKARIVVTISDDNNRIPQWIRVQILDPGHWPYVSATQGFPLPGNERSEEPSQDGRPGFSLSANSLGFLSALDAPSAGAPLLPILEEPTEHDPLQLVISDAVLQWAPHGANLVACIPDSLLSDPASDGRLRAFLDPKVFDQALKSSCRIELKETVTIVSPTSPVTATETRTGRTALQAYLKALIAIGYSSIDAQAAFAAANPEQTQLMSLWTHLTHPGVSSFQGSSYHALAFYAALSVPQKKLLMDGIAITYTDLSDRQKALVVPMLVDKPDAIYVGRYPDKVLFRPFAEASEFIDQPQQREMSITMETGVEKDVRIQGLTAAGQAIDDISAIDEIPARVANLGPWKSLRYSSGTANVIRFIFQVDPSLKIVHSLRELRTALEPGPPEVRTKAAPKARRAQPGKAGRQPEKQEGNRSHSQ